MREKKADASRDAPTFTPDLSFRTEEIAAEMVRSSSLERLIHPLHCSAIALSLRHAFASRCRKSLNQNSGYASRLWLPFIVVLAQPTLNEKSKKLAEQRKLRQQQQSHSQSQSQDDIHNRLYLEGLAEKPQRVLATIARDAGDHRQLHSQ